MCNSINKKSRNLKEHLSGVAGLEHMKICRRGQTYSVFPTPCIKTWVLYHKFWESISYALSKFSLKIWTSVICSKTWEVLWTKEVIRDVFHAPLGIEGKVNAPCAKLANGAGCTIWRWDMFWTPSNILFSYQTPKWDSSLSSSVKLFSSDGREQQHTYLPLNYMQSF